MLDGAIGPQNWSESDMSCASPRFCPSHDFRESILKILESGGTSICAVIVRVRTSRFLWGILSGRSRMHINSLADRLMDPCRYGQRLKGVGNLLKAAA